MSRLIKETDKYLEISRYVHNEPDEFPDWVYGIDENGEEFQKYPERLVEAEMLAFYEVLVTYRIDKETLKVTYLSVE